MSHRIVSILALAGSLGAAACAGDPSTAPVVGSPSLAAASGSGAGGTTTTRVRVEAPLTVATTSPFPTAHGNATWDSRGNKRELEMEIEDIKPGTSVSFFLDGAQVGATQIADDFRRAAVSLSSELGDQVPASVSGKAVEVRSGDVVIATGSFK